MNAAKRLETLKKNAKAKAKARQEYNARLDANEAAFRNVVRENGFTQKMPGVPDILDRGRVRVSINRADEKVEILVFSGAPGWTPLQYQIPISLYAPAEVAIATLKATLKTTAK